MTDEITQCYYCGKPAHWLCDFILESGTTLDDPNTTCDRPLCNEHRTRCGIMFASGKEGFIETDDRCVGHKNIQDGMRAGKRKMAKPIGAITHWMPLPKPPEKGESA